MYKSILRRIVRLRQYLINWYFDDTFIKTSKKLLIDITTDLFEDYINTKKLICILFYFHHINRNHSIKIVQQPWKMYSQTCLSDPLYSATSSLIRPFSFLPTNFTIYFNCIQRPPALRDYDRLFSAVWKVNPMLTDFHNCWYLHELLTSHSPSPYLLLVHNNRFFILNEVTISVIV